MVFLPLVLLHTSAALLPAVHPSRLVLDAATVGSSSGSAASSTGSASGSSGTVGDSGSSGSSGSDSGSGASAGSSSATASSGSGGTGGSTTGSVGTQPGDPEPGSLGVPTRCNSSDDCPLNFICTEHKCKPLSQRPEGGGCTSGGDLGLLGAMGVAWFVWTRRRAAPRA